MPTQRQHEKTICKFIRGAAPNTLYDIGVGPKSEWRTLREEYPRLKVFGCEPHPKMYADLLAAKFPGPLYPVAISDQQGRAKFHVAASNRMCSSLLPIPYANDGAAIEVDCITLDEFDAMAGKPDRIVLWIDIEGAELAAFRGGAELLASGRVRWINLEERRNGHKPTEGWADPLEVHNLLKAAGYVRTAKYNKHPTHQDVIYKHHAER